MELFILIVAIAFIFWSLLKAIRKFLTKYLISWGAGTLTDQQADHDSKPEDWKSSYSEFYKELS